MSPYKKGVFDFKNGNVTNPFKEDTTKWRNWEMGFNRAYFDNLEQVKKRENGRGKVE